MGKNTVWYVANSSNLLIMAKASSSNEFEGQILRSTKYTWKLGRCVGRGTCSVVVEAVGSFVSSTMHRRPQDIKAAVKIFKQAQRFEAAGVNEIEILEYLRRRGELTKCNCCHIGEITNEDSENVLCFAKFALVPLFS